MIKWKLDSFPPNNKLKGCTRDLLNDILFVLSCWLNLSTILFVFGEDIFVFRKLRPNNQQNQIVLFLNILIAPLNHHQTRALDKICPKKTAMGNMDNGGWFLC